MIIFKEICQKWGRIHFYCITSRFLQFMNIFFFLQSASCVTKFQEVYSSKIILLIHKLIYWMAQKEYILIKWSIINVDILQDG